MSLLSLLRPECDAIADAWIESIYRTYPFDTVGFLRKGKDEFKNPVGSRINSSVVALTKHLLGVTPLNEEKLDEALDDLVRMRAVQDFAPSKAMGAIFLIKGVVRLQLPKLGKLKDHAKELLQFESNVDSVALRAFDIYVKCKVQLYEMRVKEIKNQQAMLIRRAGLMADTPQDIPEPKQQ